MIDFSIKVKDSITFETIYSATMPGSIKIYLDCITRPLFGNCDYDSTKSTRDYMTKKYRVDAPIGVKHVF